MRAHHGHVAAVVARRFLLLVAAVVLFIDDDEAEVLHRREHAGPCADDDAAPRRANAPPLLGSFGVVKRRMEDRHPIAEAMIELAGHGGRQRDLGNQQQRTSAAASVASMARRYTSVLPEPVTPCSRKARTCADSTDACGLLETPVLLRFKVGGGFDRVCGE